MHVQQLAGFLEEKARQAETLDLRKAEGRIHEILAQEVQKNFDGSHTADGKLWAPLKNPRPAGKQILVTTGDLMRSALTTARQAHVDEHLIYWDVSPLVVYGMFHLEGTRHMPARPFLGVGDSALEGIVELAKAQIAEAWES